MVEVEVKFSHPGISASGPGLLVEWVQRVLGAEVEKFDQQRGRGFVRIGGQRIEILKGQGGGDSHLGFEVTDVAQALTHLQNLKVNLSGDLQISSDGKLATQFFKDQFGNLYHVTGPKPLT